jgi:16S rRNA U516 pseudouridylate synthase RsuA-like enzyme
VKRMAEAIENGVEALTRIRIGSLDVGDLRRGEARRLDRREIEALWKDSAP